MLYLIDCIDLILFPRISLHSTEEVYNTPRDLSPSNDVCGTQYCSASTRHCVGVIGFVW